MSQATWSEPVNISRSPDIPSINPRVLADPYGRVHVFWEEDLGHGSGIGAGDTIYNSYKTEDGWSEPQDILVAPSDGPLQLGGVAVGAQGELALVWHDSRSLYYSWAWPDEAGDARSWHTETIYGGVVSWPYLFVDARGTTHVIWEDGRSVLYMQRDAGNAEWSEVSTISAASENRRFSTPRLVVDQNQVIHAVWSETAEEQNWAQSGVWYSRSVDNGQTWSDSVYQPDRGWWINVSLDAEDQVHLVWEHGIWSSEGRWHQYSSDGGQSWSEPKVMFSPGPANGLTRWPLLGVDSAESLHYISPFNSIDLNGVVVSGGILHSEWSGQDWIDTEVLPGAIGEFADFAIGQGNQLHVVYHNVSPDNLEIWYVTRQVDAPEVALESFIKPDTAIAPTLTLQSQPHVFPVTSTISAAVSINPVPLNTSPPASNSNEMFPLLVGVLPAGLILIIFVVTKSMRRRR